MANRLAGATSPYLLQHAENPVDWWEWGEEAFAEARRRDLPILLSVGYAACHWCHVMAHESFEDDATAADLNAGFVSIKVDREERPDVDALYLQAAVALTGRGGWPLTAFLTPVGQVFHAGTYYPPEPRHGMPSFRQLLIAVQDAWQDRREELDAATARIAAVLTGPGTAARTVHPAAPGDADLAAAVHRLAADHDPLRGGFGGAPKFPPSMVLEFLLRHAARSGTDDAGSTGALALRLAESTLRAMAGSGTYDQLDGGFARYAVDAGWVVPHFEKMLYDNALLARVYLHWWRLTGDPLGRRVALETCDWMLRVLGTSEGGLASALDADTAVEGSARGVEGMTYVWTPAQLVELLGEDDGAWCAGLAGVTVEGTFEDGASTVRLLVDVDGPDADPAVVERWRSVRARLAEARAQRRQPSRDDKVVAAWNGLAIAALAEVGALLDRPDLVRAAERAADLLLTVHLAGDRLRRVSRDGVAGVAQGALEDYADVAEGLLALFAVTGTVRWAQAAGLLLACLPGRFVTADGGFSDSPVDAPDRLLRAAYGQQPADPSDNAYPGGVSAAAQALLTWSALTGDGRARSRADQALRVVTGVSRHAPRFAGWGLAAAEAALDGPRQVAVLGDLQAADTRRLWSLALRGTAPGLVVAAGDPGRPPAVPLLTGRPAAADGAALAYPCRGMVCDLPTDDPDALAAFCSVPG